MTISFPLTLPSGGIVDIQFKTQSSTAMTQSPFTGQQQVFEHAGQWWEAVVTLAPMNRATAAEWQAFFLSLRGRKGTFMLGDPDATTPRGTPSGTPLVNGASQTGSSLATDGWTPDATGLLLKGDYIQIGNHMYMVLNDVDADGSGEATIDVWPRLRADVDDNDPIITSNCKCIFRLTSNDIGWSADRLSHYRMSFACAEVING